MAAGMGFEPHLAVGATMRAARFYSASGTLRVEQVPVPEPGPDEVLIRVRACGICLSDVHMLDGSMPTMLDVVTPGHEAAGEVAALGAQVTGWELGQHVVMVGGKPCWTCAECQSGRHERCPSVAVMGFGYDGAWAEYVVVPALVLTPIPDTLPFEQAAILADAVTTPYGGLVGRAHLAAGETIGLWGIGGLGVHAVQIARLQGAAAVIAVDPHPAARTRALAAGADHALDPAQVDVAHEVQRLTDGHGLDVAVDLVGSNAVLAEAASCLARFGRLLMIGLSTEPLELGPGVLFGIGAHTLMGHLGYGKADLDQVVQLVADGRLDVSASVSALLPLTDIADGVDRLRTRRGDPIRLVVIP